MSKSLDKHFNFCKIVRKYFVCSRTLLNLSVELVFYHFVNHILTNSTDFLTINSFYRPVCDGLKTHSIILLTMLLIVMCFIFIFSPRKSSCLPCQRTTGRRYMMLLSKEKVFGTASMVRTFVICIVFKLHIPNQTHLHACIKQFLSFFHTSSYHVCLNTCENESRIAFEDSLLGLIIETVQT